MESSNGADVEAEAAESTSATGTAINTNNQDNKRAAEDSGGAQQPSASKKPRRNPRGKPIAGRAKQTKRRTEQRAQAKKRKAEAESEESEREAGGGAEGKPDAD